MKSMELLRLPSIHWAPIRASWKPGVDPALTRETMPHAGPGASHSGAGSPLEPKPLTEMAGIVGRAVGREVAAWARQ
ncbi:hypothetical protein AAFF_G00225610 [Aldrovandia affinis]|uniref:Uncharacterized protein n=1 Tax=Aldrovandia affinis TaxID=143900 RepID=A0AAD7X2F7_9TELE|nr:hypothetical protein AAFF_G00225610 [Aldrovandia affinis]